MYFLFLLAKYEDKVYFIDNLTGKRAAKCVSFCLAAIDCRETSVWTWLRCWSSWSETIARSSTASRRTRSRCLSTSCRL